MGKTVTHLKQYHVCFAGENYIQLLVAFQYNICSMEFVLYLYAISS